MNQTYVALLRGINVGGHKKVPMAELKSLLSEMGFESVKTLLNSGNVVFNAHKEDERMLENTLTLSLEKHFGFTIPVLVRSKEDFVLIAQNKAFENISVTKDIRLYINFMKNPSQDIFDKEPGLPNTLEDGSFSMLCRQYGAVYSILDVSKIKSTDAMVSLEKIYGKDITTRNLNTVQKITALF